MFLTGQAEVHALCRRLRRAFPHARRGPPGTLSTLGPESLPWESRPALPSPVSGRPCGGLLWTVKSRVLVTWVWPQGISLLNLLFLQKRKMKIQ